MLLTNGTDDAIKMICDTFVDPEDVLLVPAPTFPVYEFFHNIAGGKVVRVRYDENFRLPVEQILAALSKRVRWLALANPNNPTGTGVSLEGLEAILEKAPAAAVLIDEAYYEFSGITALPLLGRYPNLFVSRTFSKVYGMAAMRLGCLFSQAPNICCLHKAQSPYSVNALAALAARAAIRDGDYVARYVAEALAARELLYQEFERLKIPYYRSQANFVLARFGDRAIEIRDRLRAAGVLVRDRSYELEGCVRITVGTREQVQQLVTLLEEVW